MDTQVTENLKSEILLSLKTETSAVMKSEMKSILAEDFDFLKNELHPSKAVVQYNKTEIHLGIK